MKKRYTPEEKVVILRRHLLEKEPVSKRCDEIRWKPTVLYRWRRGCQQVLRLERTLRQGNDHNGWVPRNFWLEEGEKQAIVGLHRKNPLEGYRRLTVMMLDADTRAGGPANGGGVVK